MTKILVVDDDPAIRQVVGFALQKAGFQVVEASDGREALIAFGREAPALLVLDINMPEMSGTDVCRTIRADSSVPIVFLSSNDDEIDRILGLELGGDDYLTKPFSPRELTARVRAVLRRTEQKASSKEANVMSQGDLSLNLDRFEATWGGESVILTVTEFGIVRTLLRYKGKVYSRGELMHGAYEDFTVVSDRTIDSHVRRVRQKFARAGAGDVVETVHGVGYRIGKCVTE
ncbi:MAG: two-component system OmpR family response regulator [Bradymonadia bacterium]|jgi:two-component system OmpR family response regulator